MSRSMRRSFYRTPRLALKTQLRSLRLPVSDMPCGFCPTEQIAHDAELSHVFSMTSFLNAAVLRGFRTS